MAKEIMDRRASDNVYLHKDFHSALSTSIEYLHRHFGSEAVSEYLRKFTRTYYAPLTVKLNNNGLVALKEHFQKIYDIEGEKIEISFTENELVLTIKSCPAVKHMREHNYPVARLFMETTKTVNEALCEGTPFKAELVEYDELTGHSIQRFYRAIL
ncbi:MAG: hypothetical protein JXB48_05205 [Candidatus Latescibacteria bacterium]|nr:hypothetical protein [Candidatus Latescibacterota bacterium]